MPFDGTVANPVLKVVDRMIDLIGERKHWGQHTKHSLTINNRHELVYSKHCLIGALEVALKTTHEYSDQTLIMHDQLTNMMAKRINRYVDWRVHFGFSRHIPDNLVVIQFNDAAMTTHDMVIDLLLDIRDQLTGVDRQKELCNTFPMMMHTTPTMPSMEAPCYRTKNSFEGIVPGKQHCLVS